MPLLGGGIFFYILAAVLPAVILMRYIYKKDKVEKEPGRLLLQLFFLGFLAAFASMILEAVGQEILDLALPQQSVAHIIVLAFIVVAASEEGMKLLFCWMRTRHDPNFDCRFDGIVYMVFTSLGFAAIENIIYVFSYGISVAPMRALLSVPAHMGFAVVGGALYGRAKQHHLAGETFRSRLLVLCSFLSSVLLHGFYDACAMIGSVRATAVFYVFVVLMYIFIILLIRDESRTDRYF